MLSRALRRVDVCAATCDATAYARPSARCHATAIALPLVPGPVPRDGTESGPQAEGQRDNPCQQSQGTSVACHPAWPGVASVRVVGSRRRLASGAAA